MPCVCGAEGDGRCPACGALAARVCRALARLGDDTKEIWNDSIEQGKIDRATFNSSAKNLMGDDLTKLITETLEVVTKEENEVTLVGTGDYLDEADLKDKYKDKPERCRAILKNTRKFKCPISETVLYEDMHYHSLNRQTSISTVTKKRAAVTEHKVKKAAKPKAAASASEAPQQAAERNAVTLSAKELETIDKFSEKLTKAQNDLNNVITIADAPENKEFMNLVPSYVVQSIKALQLKVEESEVQFHAAKQDGVADFKTIKAAWIKTSLDVKEGKRRATLQIEEAKKMTKPK